MYLFVCKAVLRLHFITKNLCPLVSPETFIDNIRNFSHNNTGKLLPWVPEVFVFLWQSCSDRTSHIFKHIQNSQQCRTSCSKDCFSILDRASTTFQLKVEDAIFNGKNLN